MKGKVMKASTTLSAVEARALERSGQKLMYSPGEKIGVVVVKSFPLLGSLTAMRFLEWVQRHPEGVISLPTGKTPEYFIKEVGRLLAGWGEKAVRRELEEWGIDPARRPPMRGLHFVQIDEFYPINPLHHNSFHFYVRQFYLDGFGLDPGQALLIDCSRIGLPAGKSLEEVWPEGVVDLSLRYRPGRNGLERLQKRVIENIDQWCAEYEARVEALGGIGFFLGGIGPDGHIGFNVRGSDPFSTTRLAATNYETQAAAAADLGGIEVARARRVITIGLATITANPDCVAIIMAAGEAKAAIVAESVQSEPHVHYPASALQVLPGARFYLTGGAAGRLRQRQGELLLKAESASDEQAERIVIDLALARRTPILRLSAEDFRSDPFAAALLAKRPEGAEALCRQAADRLRARLEAGTRIYRDTVFLHTEPHHDDLMLGYMPFIVRHIREHSTRHYFATMTSGFTAVTNRYMLRQLAKLRAWIGTPAFAGLARQGYFEPASRVFHDRDVWQYLDGVAGRSRPLRENGEMRRLVRNLVALFDERDVSALADRVAELENYFQTQYPGKRDLEHIQRLKGMCREWEADCLWGYFGWSSDHVRHLRLGFYTGEIFTGEPTVDRDVLPILKLLEEIRPGVVTLALDPEASGPDTHYKVLQAVTEALRRYVDAGGNPDIQVLGYRNVWYRFHPAEANLFVPVSLNMFSLVQSAFMNTFISQKEASFPSPEHEGPFSELAQRIQVRQYQMLKTCLGREFFYEHPSALIRATRGMVFLKKMSLPELYERSRELQASTEDR
jgi:glucosamine-6-phosphate deaminase